VVIEAMWFERDSHDAVRRKLGLLIRCHERILPHLTTINSLASTILDSGEYKYIEYAPQVKRAKKQLEHEVSEAKDLFTEERSLSVTVELVDEKLYAQLVRDLDIAHRTLERMESLLAGLDDILDNYHRFQESGAVFSELRALQDPLASMQKQERYQEHLLADVIDAIRQVWEERLHGKSAWLYHATSVLFLPSISEHGIDPTKLPSSIIRALEKISQVLLDAKRRGGIAQRGGMGFDLQGLGESFTQRGTYFSWRQENIRDSAAAADLPAFLYELFDEQVTEKALPRIKRHLTPEERRICDVIWRFGRILRAKNKVVMLRVKVDSDFLRYLGLPDYYGDYDSFITHYVRRFVPLFVSAHPQAIALNACPPHHEIFSRLYQASFGWDVEIYLKERIPARFIYVDVPSADGSVPMNVGEWTPAITPTFL
jgi:hypothetical protein